MRPDFSLIWGSDNAPFTPIEASDYTAGWVFRTGAPPRRVNFDYYQNLADQRANWLGEQMLLAVGHEWQDDVTYDAYAVVRSPVNGQLYRSLVGGNLGNEPSISGAQWTLGIASLASETVAGLIEIATDAEAQAFAAGKAIDGAKLDTAFKGGNQSLAVSGYQKLPGGLIIQWGRKIFSFAGVGTLNTSVTFPIAFPNQVLSVSSQAETNFAAELILVTSLSTVNNTTATLYTKSVNSYTGSVPVLWIAIGC